VTAAASPPSPLYDDVVQITSVIGGQTYLGSGVMIAPGEVLTASHVVYAQGVGTATSVTVTPGGSVSLGSYQAAAIHCNPVADAGGAQSAASAQQDFAVIKLSSPVDGVGTMGIGEGYTLGGPGITTGFPTTLGGVESVSNRGTAYPVSDYSLLEIPPLGPGSSGGPCWITNPDGTACAVAVASIEDAAGNQYGPLFTAAAVAEIQGWLSQDGVTAPLSNEGRIMVTTDRNGLCVGNLYQGVLGRLPDSPGFVAWHRLLDGGTVSVTQIAADMLASPEFTGTHAGQTATQFVEGLYEAMLGRPGSQAEVSYYTAEIAAGAPDAAIAAQFAQSPEAIQHCQSWMTLL
jgi:hypothetical protein